MRRAFCLLLGLASVSAAGQDFALPSFDSVSVSAPLSYRWLNPGANVLGLESWQSVPVTTLEGHWIDLHFAASAWADAWKAELPQTWFRFQELYVASSLGNNLRYFVGKHTLSWDGSPFFRPLDFFSTNRAELNPEDSSLPDEGRLGAGLSWGADSGDVSLAVFDDRWVPADPWNRRGGVHAGVKGRLFVDPASISLAANTVWNAEQGFSTAVGGNLTTLLGESWQLYASGTVRRGSLEPVHQGALGEPEFFTEDPVATSRFTDAGFYPEILVGAQWDGGPGQSVSLAYSYNAEKLNDEEWTRLADTLAYHQGPAAAFFPTDLVRANSIWDAAYSSQVIRRQHHVAGTLRAAWGEAEGRLSAVVSVVDGSLLSHAAVSMPLGIFVFESGLTYWWGRAGSEFGSHPLRCILQSSVHFSIP